METYMFPKGFKYRIYSVPMRRSRNLWKWTVPVLWFKDEPQCREKQQVAGGQQGLFLTLWQTSVLEKVERKASCSTHLCCALLQLCSFKNREHLFIIPDRKVSFGVEPFQLLKFKCVLLLACRANLHRSKCSCHPKQVQQGTAGPNTGQTKLNSILQIFFIKNNYLINLILYQAKMITERHQGWWITVENLSGFYQAYILQSIIDIIYILCDLLFSTINQ